MLRVEVDGDDAEQVAAADVSNRHAFCKEQKARRLATPLSLSLGDTVRVPVLLVALFVPVMAQAEVLDKELGLVALLIIALSGALTAFAVARYRPWLLTVVLPVFAVIFSVQLAELLDPAVGPALRFEGGFFYTLMSWSGPFLFVTGVLMGFLVRRRSRSSVRTT